MLANFVSGNRSNRFVVDNLVDYQDKPSVRRESPSRGASTRPASAFTNWIGQDCFNVLLRQIVIGHVRDIAIWVVIEIPENFQEIHNEFAASYIIPSWRGYENFARPKTNTTNPLCRMGNDYANAWRNSSRYRGQASRGSSSSSYSSTM
jgi:hypothetical protein